MTFYFDSSAILRILLREPGRIEGLEVHLDRVSSVLATVETSRALDRLRLQGTLADTEHAAHRGKLADLFSTMHLVEMSPGILARAAEPLSAVVGTLDAIHLATARLWREERAEELTVVTHDLALARAALTFGIPVIPKLNGRA